MAGVKGEQSEFILTFDSQERTAFFNHTNSYFRAYVGRILADSFDRTDIFVASFSSW